MKPTIEELREQARERIDVCARLKQMLVEHLELPIPGSWITDFQPLFGRGLELDSLDALEIMVGVESSFGVSLYDDEMNVFGSISALADRIAEASVEALV